MTAPDPRLGEIEDRLSAHYEEIAYMSGSARHYCAEDGKKWPCDDVTDYAQEDIRYLLAELRTAREALARVEGVVDEWEDLAGSGSDWERVYGKQKVSVEFAVSRIRAAVAAADGGSDAHD